MAIDVLQMMEEESNRASSAGSGSGVPLFLWFKGNMKASLRPLVNLDKVIVVKMHSRYNPGTGKFDVQAVCPGAGCVHCATVANNPGDKEAKKLTANTVFMLPVYVYGIKQKNEAGVWIDVMYKDADSLEKPVSGFRLLELTSFGAINDVFQYFRKFYADTEMTPPHDLTARNFVIERVEQGKKILNGKEVAATITYVCIHKDASPMSDTVKAAIPTPEKVQELVSLARPPALLGGVAPSSNGNGATPAQDESIPDF